MQGPEARYGIAPKTCKSDAAYEHLELVCQNISNDITKLEKKLELSVEGDVNLPSVEPLDTEKKKLKDKLIVLESQQATFTERFKSFHNELLSARKDIYKLRQKIKYKNMLDQSYHRVMQPVDFSELKTIVLDTKPVNRELSDLTQENIDKLMEDIPFPSKATNEELIEFMKYQLASSLLQKEKLLEEVARLELKISVQEQFVPPSSDSKKETEVEKTGFLLKKAGNKWEKKFFHLFWSPEKKIYLLSYRIKEKGPTVGTLALPYCIVQISDDPKIKGDFCFIVTPRMVAKKDKKFFLCAESHQEMHDWLHSLQIASSTKPTQEEINKLGYKLIDD